jgi:hypothetical protein
MFRGPKKFMPGKICYKVSKGHKQTLRNQDLSGVIYEYLYGVYGVLQIFDFFLYGNCLT